MSRHSTEKGMQDTGGGFREVFVLLLNISWMDYGHFHASSECFSSRFAANQ